MAAEYRVLWAAVTDPTTILGELPLESVALGHVLNAPGFIQGTVPLDPYGPARKQGLGTLLYPSAWYDPAVESGVDRAAYVALEPTNAQVRATAKTLFGPSSFGSARTCVYVERDGVILKGGIVWGHQASVSGGSLTFTAEGWHSYIRRHVIVSDLSYSAQDQDTIARGLVEHAQAQGGGDLGIGTAANAHGVTRDRYYYWWESKNLGEALEQLAAVNNGFDFDYVSSYDTNGDPQTNFVTRYPTSGRVTNHVFELGTNVELVDYTEDGKSVVNWHRAFGAGIGTEIQIVDRFSGTGVYPLLPSVSTHSNVTRVATLGEHADHAITRGRVPTVFLTLQVHPDAIPGVGSYQVGDQVSVTADYGYIQLDRATFRIVTHNLAVSTGGEVSTITLAPVEVFT